MTRPLAWMAALMVLTVTPAAAQNWQLAAGYHHDFIASDDPAWSDWQRASAALARRFTAGSIELEGAHVVRFGEDEWVGSVDAYRDLWQRAYGNLRVAIAPDALSLPETDIYAELFQGLSAGLELSGSYRYMHFDEPVHALGGGVGYFTGDLYLRARVTASRLSGTTGATIAASARHGSRDAFLEAALGTGKEVVMLAPDEQELRTVGFALVRGQRFLTSHFGAEGSVGWNEFSGVPRRITVGARVLWRW